MINSNIIHTKNINNFIMSPPNIIKSNNEYKDFNNYNETIWRIKLGYEEIPICPVCKSKHIKFLGSPQQGFCKTCSREC